MLMLQGLAKDKDGERVQRMIVNPGNVEGRIC